MRGFLGEMFIIPCMFPPPIKVCPDDLARSAEMIFRHKFLLLCAYIVFQRSQTYSVKKPYSKYLGTCKLYIRSPLQPLYSPILTWKRPLTIHKQMCLAVFQIKLYLQNREVDRIWPTHFIWCTQTGWCRHRAQPPHEMECVIRSTYWVKYLCTHIYISTPTYFQEKI